MEYSNYLFGTKKATKIINERYSFSGGDSDGSSSDTQQTIFSTTNTASSHTVNKSIDKSSTTSYSNRIASKPAVKIPARATLNDDTVLKAKLEEASRNVPRYLFRVWDTNSGGSSKLNTTSAVQPHAFYHGTGHESVYDMTRSEFVRNTRVHLEGGSEVLSEFSSWSHSPYFAFHHANQRDQNSGTAHVAIMDTEELASSNPAFHVPALGKILNLESSYPYDEEFLVHGVIKGKFYKAVPFAKLRELGLIAQFPSLKKYMEPYGRGATYALPKGIVPYSVPELCELKRIGLVFGGEFSIPFAIVLFCCKRRPRFFSNLKASDLKRIVNVLGGREKIPLQWAGSRSVFCDGVVPEHYQASEQMVNLMRALHTYSWGKGARNRARHPTLMINSVLSDSSSDEDYTPDSMESSSDNEDIVTGMSSMNVSPASRRISESVSHSTSTHNLLLLLQPSRKRPRPQIKSIDSLYTPFGYCIPHAIPLSRISSPYELHTTDHHKSGMVASSGVTELYAASQESRSTTLGPLQIKSVCSDDRIVMTWCVSKFSYSRISYYKKLEFWMSSGNSSTDFCKGIDFRCTYTSDEQVWYTVIEANFNVKINGHHFNSNFAVPVGPIPPFSIWECDDDVFFLYVGASAVSYQAVADNEDGSGAAPKRRKRDE